jgi:glycosyltransferase involved in cell wall biosynthesis
LTTGLGARFATEFWAVSRFTATQLHRHNTFEVPTYVLPNALGEGVPVPSDREARPPALLSVSRLDTNERYKGLDLALRAHALLLNESPDLEFHIVGDGTDLPRLRRVAADMRTEHRVKFLGRVNAAMLTREYEQCVVFVLPSRGEGFGIVFLEAMARGKPIVALRCGAVPEVVVDGECGLLVDDDDLLGLYESLRRLVKDEALRARFGRNGRERVRTLFTQEAFRGRLDDLLAGRAIPLAAGNT